MSVNNEFLRAPIAFDANGLTLVDGRGTEMRALALVLVGFFTGTAVAESAGEPPADPIFPVETVEDLSQFVWEKRPIVVFADSPNDLNFKRQIELLQARRDDLAERDVVVLTDTDPAVTSPLRKKLRPRGFALVLIGKDGGVKLRKPAPWDVRALSRVIDKMPIRQQEIRDRRSLGE